MGNRYGDRPTQVTPGFGNMLSIQVGAATSIASEIRRRV